MRWKWFGGGAPRDEQGNSAPKRKKEKWQPRTHEDWETVGNIRRFASWRLEPDEHYLGATMIGPLSAFRTCVPFCPMAIGGGGSPGSALLVAAVVAHQALKFVGSGEDPGPDVYDNLAEPLGLDTIAPLAVTDNRLLLFSNSLRGRPEHLLTTWDIDEITHMSIDHEETGGLALISMGFSDGSRGGAWCQTLGVPDRWSEVGRLVRAYHEARRRRSLSTDDGARGSHS